MQQHTTHCPSMVTMLTVATTQQQQAHCWRGVDNVLCCAVLCCVQSIKKVFVQMKAGGAPVDLYMYKHCGHAFMNALTAGGRDKIKGDEPPTAAAAAPPSPAVLSVVSGVLSCCVRIMPLMHTHRLLLCRGWPG